MLLEEVQIDENDVAYIPSLGITFQLNEAGKRAIELLKEGKSKDDIVLILSQDYGVDWKRVYKDVEDFILKLKIYGLLS